MPLLPLVHLLLDFDLLRGGIKMAPVVMANTFTTTFKRLVLIFFNSDDFVFNFFVHNTIIVSLLSGAQLLSPIRKFALLCYTHNNY
jgi:hypothetical protein